MTSAQSPRGGDDGFQKARDGEENLLCGIVGDLSVTDNGRDGLVIDRAVLIFPMTAKNKPEASPGKLFDARHTIDPDIGQGTAFDNRDRFRLFVKSHDNLPGSKLIPGIVTHQFHNTNGKIFVSRIDSGIRYETPHFGNTVQSSCRPINNADFRSIEIRRGDRKALFRSGESGPSVTTPIHRAGPFTLAATTPSRDAASTRSGRQGFASPAGAFSRRRFAA